MPAPNLRAPKSIKGRTETFLAQTTSTALIANPIGSNKVFKVNTILCANLSASLAPAVTLSRFNGDDDHIFVPGVTLPIETTLVACSKETYFYVNEGESLKGLATNSDAVGITVGYEEIE
jgi:hypothetical protein